MKYIRIMHNSSLFLLMIILSGVSCSVLEPAIPSAGYIHIDSIILNTDSIVQGSNSKNITDAWIIYDDAFLGTFPLPADIPLIGEGSHNVIVRAGIIENGISSIRSAYPKYSSFETTVNLTANQKNYLSPAVSYSAGIQFPQVEDFDDASLSLVTTNIDYAPLIITPLADPNAYEGNSGQATLDSNHPIFEAASSAAFVLPLYTPTYLELNYKGENDFGIGVFINTAGGVVKSGLLSVKASTIWKKIYVSISDLGGVQQSGIDYKIYLRAEKNAALTTATIYFDNLKVVY